MIKSISFDEIEIIENIKTLFNSGENFDCDPTFGISKWKLIGVLEEMEGCEEFSLCSQFTQASSELITIDLDTAKFDPFAAMREGVKVTASQPTYGYVKHGMIQTCQLSQSEPVFVVYELDKMMGFMNAKTGDISIHLDWAAQQEGVEVVE